jgi:hypothetical protein
MSAAARAPGLVRSGEAWLLKSSSVKMINLVGYPAASLVLATFCMRSMSALRSMALASNLGLDLNPSEGDRRRQ